MGMTPEQVEELKSLKYIKDCRDDNIKNKEIIKNILKSDPRIIHVLNNPNLDEDNPDDYIDVNIKPQILIPEVQYEIQNFICFKTEMNEVSEDNSMMYSGYITFMIFCDTKNIKTEYGISRHDLLGYLIKDNFQWGNSFGFKSKLVKDSETVTDTSFNCRTIVFAINSTNGIYKGSNPSNTIVYTNNKKYIGNYGVSSRNEEIW